MLPSNFPISNYHDNQLSFHPVMELEGVPYTECSVPEPFLIESTPFSRLFKWFLQLGLFNEDLAFLPAEALLGIPLPELKEEQLQRIYAHFTKTIEISSHNLEHSYYVTLNEQLDWLFEKHSEIESLEIAGSEIYQILGKEWFVRYFERLGCPELIDHLLQEMFEKKSNDLDLHLNAHGEEKPKLEKMGNEFAAHLINCDDSQFHLKKQEFFPKCHPFDNGLNRGFGIAFGKDHKIDLTFVGLLYRAYIFDHDCISIKIDKTSLRQLIKGNFVDLHLEVSGKVHGGWSGPLLWASKMLHTNPFGMNLAAAAVMFSHYTKGAEAPLLSLENAVADKVFSALGDIRGREDALNVLRKALCNHLPPTIEAATSFCFNVCAILLRQSKPNLINRSLIQALLSENSRCEHELLMHIHQVMHENHDLFPLLIAYLIVQAHLMSLRQQICGQQSGLTLCASQQNAKSAFQLRICTNDHFFYLLLPMSLEQAMQLLKASSSKIALFKELDGCFCQDSVPLHVADVGGANVATMFTSEELTLAIEFLKNRSLKKIGFTFLCLSEGQSVKNPNYLGMLTEALITLFKEPHSAEFLLMAMHHFIYYCQANLPISNQHLQTQMAEIEASFSLPETSAGSRTQQCLNFLAAIPHDTVFTATYKAWKGMLTARKDELAPLLGLSRTFYSTHLKSKPENAVKVLIDLLRVTELATETCKGYFNAICHQIRKRPLESDKGIILRLKEALILLCERLKQCDDGCPMDETTHYFWLFDILCDYVPLDALHLIGTLEELLIQKDPQNASFFSENAFLDKMKLLVPKVLQKVPKKSSPSDLKIFQKAKDYIIRHNIKLAKENKSLQASLCLLSHQSIELWFSPKELSQLWGKLFLEKLEMANQSLDSTIAPIVLELFNVYNEKLAHAPIMQQACLYQVGQLLPKIYLIHKMLSTYDQIIAMYFKKYGPAGCCTLLKKAADLFEIVNSSSQSLTSLKMSSHTFSLKGLQRENFFSLLEGLLNQLLLHPSDSELDHEFICMEFNVYLSMMANFYPSKATKIYDLLHAFAFRSLPMGEMVPLMHVNCFSILFKDLGSLLSYDFIGEQKYFEMKLYMQLEIVQSEKTSEENQRSGVVNLVTQLINCKYRPLTNRAIYTLNKLPASLFKKSLPQLKACYDHLFKTLEETPIVCFEDFSLIGDMLNNSLCLESEAYASCPENYIFVTSSIFENYFDFVIDGHNRLTPTAAQSLQLCQVLVCTVLKAIKLSPLKQECNAIFNLLNKLITFSVQLVCEGKNPKLLSLFHFIKGIYQNQEQGKTLLAIAFSGWIRSLVALPNNIGDPLAEEAIVTQLYHDLMQYLPS